jgi:hypothetical protein
VGNTTAAVALIVAQEPDPPSALRIGVPSELDGVVAKALAKKKEDRYPTVEALSEALLPWCPKEPIAGERLRAIVSETKANRDAGLIPSTGTSPTLIRPKRAVVAATTSSKAPPRSDLFWVLVGLVVGLPFAAAIAYFALR